MGSSCANKKFAKTFLLVAGISLLLFWAAYGLYLVTAPAPSLLFFASPPPQPDWQILLNKFSRIALGALSIPAYAMFFFVNGNSRLVLVLLSLLSSTLWGLYLGLPIYGIRRRLQKQAA
jgi:hypothetical protein